jgi:hypothetical protein
VEPLILPQNIKYKAVLSPFPRVAGLTNAKAYADGVNRQIEEIRYILKLQTTHPMFLLLPYNLYLNLEPYAPPCPSCDSRPCVRSSLLHLNPIAIR